MNDLTTTQQAISDFCDGLKRFLIAKNKNYGNSAVQPVRVFSKASPDEGMKVRMDDKLSRIANASELRRNDLIDLAGYIAIYCANKNWVDLDDLVD